MTKEDCGVVAVCCLGTIVLASRIYFYIKDVHRGIRITFPSADSVESNFRVNSDPYLMGLRPPTYTGIYFEEDKFIIEGAKLCFDVGKIVFNRIIVEPISLADSLCRLGGVHLTSFIRMGWSHAGPEPAGFAGPEWARPTGPANPGLGHAGPGFAAEPGFTTGTEYPPEKIAFEYKMNFGAHQISKFEFRVDQAGLSLNSFDVEMNPINGEINPINDAMTPVEINTALHGLEANGSDITLIDTFNAHIRENPDALTAIVDDGILNDVPPFPFGYQEESFFQFITNVTQGAYNLGINLFGTGLNFIQGHVIEIIHFFF